MTGLLILIRETQMLQQQKRHMGISAPEKTDDHKGVNRDDGAGCV
jgi:hypothetical protein